MPCNHNYDWQNNWHLQHKRENKRISCASYQHMVAEYYRQWRDPDGSIPWTMEGGHSHAL